MAQPQYHLNKRKLREVFEKVGKNELDATDLKKYGLLTKSVQHIKDVYVFPIQDWISYYDEVERTGSNRLMYTFELQDFPTKLIPFINVELIGRTQQTGDVNEAVYMDDWLNHAEEYLSQYEMTTVENYWKLNHTILAETTEDITHYYLKVMVWLNFVPQYYDSDFTNVKLPLEFKLIGVIHNPEEYNEVSSNKA